MEINVSDTGRERRNLKRRGRREKTGKKGPEGSKIMREIEEG